MNLCNSKRKNTKQRAIYFHFVKTHEENERNKTKIIKISVFLIWNKCKIFFFCICIFKNVVSFCLSLCHHIQSSMYITLRIYKYTSVDYFWVFLLKYLLIHIFLLFHIHCILIYFVNKLIVYKYIIYIVEDNMDNLPIFIFLLLSRNLLISR